MNWTAVGRAGAARSSAEEAGSVRDQAHALTADALQRQYLRSVYRYVARHIAPRQEAEDVTAEVFEAAFQSLGRYRGQCSPQAWLFGIARRKIADSLRRSARRREVTGDDLPNDALADELCAPHRRAERAEEQAAMRALVDALPSDQREALLLQYVDGLTIAEIAAVMGRSTAAANSLLQRARQAIYRAGQGYFLATDEVQR